MTATAAVLALVLASSPAVTSDSDCPSAHDVATQLSRLLSDDADEGTVYVTARANAVDVQLEPSHGAASTRHEVAVVGGCHERASAVAVVVATWWPPSRAPVTANSSDPQRSPHDRRAHDHELALAPAAFMSLGSGGVVPGLRLDALWWRWSDRLAPRLALAVAGPYSGALAQGEARFVRTAVEVGLAHGGRHVTVDASVLGSGAWIRGSGYDANRTAIAWAVGASAGIRAGWSFDAWAPWVGLRAVYWPQAQRIFVRDAVTDAETSQSLPHAEAQIELGLTFSLL